MARRGVARTDLGVWPAGVGPCHWTWQSFRGRTVAADTRARGPVEPDDPRLDAGLGRVLGQIPATTVPGRNICQVRVGLRPRAESAIASARRSVSRVLSRPASRRNGDGHPSGAAGRPTAHAADPRAGQRTSPPPAVARRRVAPSYLALLRVEFARFTPVGDLRRRAASSLWHWSSPHGGRALPATLRCGARTFLTPSTGSPPSPTRSHPTASLT